MYLYWFFKHLIILFPIFLGFGISGYFLYDFEPSFLFSMFVLVGSVSFVVVFRFLFSQKGDSLFFEFLYILSLCFFIISVGFFRIKLKTDHMSHYVLENKIDNVMLKGIVIEKENLTEDDKSSFRVVLAKLSFLNNDLMNKNIDKIRIKIFKDGFEKDINVGDYLKVEAVLFPPAKPSIPSGYSFARYAYYKNFSAVGYALKTSFLDERSSPKLGFFTKLKIKVNSLRDIINRKIESDFSKEIASVLSALIIGYKNNVPYEIVTNYRASGLAHLISISGFHIAIAALLVFLFFRFLLSLFYNFSNRFNIIKISAFLAIIFVSFYLVISGARIPTVRAYIMTLVVLGAIIIDRKGFSLNTISVSAVFILIISPEALLDISFQMSFAAAGALISFYEYINTTERKFIRFDPIDSFFIFFIKRVGVFFLSVLITSTVCYLAVLPIVLYHFNTVSTYSLLGNLAAVPILILIITPFIFLYFIPFISGYAAEILDFGVSLINGTAEKIASFNNSVLYLSNMPFLSFVFFILFLLSIFYAQKKKYIAFLFFIPAVLIWYFNSPYNIFVNDTGKLVAFYDNLENEKCAIKFTKTKYDNLTKEIWLKSIGCEPDLKNLDYIKYNKYGSYLYNKNGYTFAYTKDYKQFDYLCKNADFIITPFVMYDDEKERCKAQVFDKLYLKENLGVFIKIKKDGLSIDNVKNNIGSRPWN